MKEPAPGRPAARPHAPRCAHCGLPVPPALVRDGALLQFCCLACEHVHEVLQGLGFQEYYHRARLAGALPAAARVSGRGFEDFDETGFQAQHVTTDATGRRSAQLYLEGVHCAACVWLVEKLPEVVPGLASVRLNLATSVAEVVFDGDETRLSAIGRALDDVGYTPHAYRSDETRRLRRREERTLLLRLGVAAAAAMNIMFLQGALYAGELQGGLDRGLETFFRWLALGLSLPVMLFSARPFLVAAWAGLRRRVPHIDLPVSLALLAAFAASAAATLRGAGPVYFDSLAALVALLLGARYLQARGQRFALERAESLRGVAFASFARRLEAGDPAATPVEVPLAALRPDDRVEVRSGELVPVDGTVLAGRSALDNGVLTGESEPVEVQEGDHVHAGATNLGARLVVRVEATGTATRVGGLLALVEDSLSRRPHLVELADRASRWFVVAVLLLAGVAGFLGWMRSPEEALERLVALLVVTCPCALALATPLAMTSGVSRAARAGFFIKHPGAVEQLRRIDTVFLDKTGTLTEGRARVTRWAGAAEAPELALLLESHSDHAVARALRRSMPGPAGAAPPLDEVREEPGLGIEGRVGARRVRVGSRAFLAAMPANEGLEEHAAALLGEGLSPLWVAVDGRAVAVAGVGDPLRGDAADTLRALAAAGIEPRILSGDHPVVVARVAAALGIPPEHALGGLTPEAKRDHLAAFRAAGARRAAMVGDGVNDAAAMALADVGVAVAGGAGAALLAADVVVTRPGLSPLLDLLRGARRILGTIHRSLAFSLFYNLLGAALALLGLVGPLLAALLMPVSSLTVILSSVLARPFPAPRGGGAAP